MLINIRQQVVIVVSTVVIIGMMLFPPWIRTHSKENMYSEHPVGYGFILSPPRQVVSGGGMFLPKDNVGLFGLKVDYIRLVIQLLSLLMISGLLFYVLGKTKKDKN